MAAPDWPAIIERLRREGVPVAEPASPHAVGGGLDATWRLDTAAGPVFLKTCAAAHADRLEAEAEGVRELARAAEVRVPRVLACATTAGCGVLALEWLPLERFPKSSETLDGMLGTQLAALHRHTRDRFGWHRDNYIGLTPQKNTPDDDWPRFFADRRLRYQLELAAANGFAGELPNEGRELVSRLDRFFDDAPPASLLHGDLWSGNRASVAGAPVMFDPAVYYGDRETDLAMTRLFGGFGPTFYRSYERAWPLPAGHGERDALYRLYHVLNHLNLFGAAYLGQALKIVRRLNRL